MTTAPKTTRRQRGFTLVEAIVVMVIVGILAGVMVLFIRRPVQNYVDSAARAEMSEAADLALRRMTRELRGALPNSVRLNAAGGVWWLEFIPTKAGGQYLTPEDNPSDDNPIKGKPLNFNGPNAQTFSVVGPMPAAPYAIVPGDFITIYNLGPGFPGADAYARGNLALVTKVLNNDVSFESYQDGAAHPNAINPFVPAAGAVPNSSPDHRFQVVGRPVTFRCQGGPGGTGTLTRSVAADFYVSQPTPTAAAGALLANNVLGCDFSVTSMAHRQSALIGLNLALARASPNSPNGVETVTLSDQIHVDNTP
jgi:MSHA biogenesis protein MshO